MTEYDKNEEGLRLPVACYYTNQSSVPTRIISHLFILLEKPDKFSPMLFLIGKQLDTQVLCDASNAVAQLERKSRSYGWSAYSTENREFNLKPSFFLKTRFL